MSKSATHIFNVGGGGRRILLHFDSNMVGEIKFWEFSSSSNFHVIPFYSSRYTRKKNLIKNKARQKNANSSSLFSQDNWCRADMKIRITHTHDAVGTAQCPCAALMRVMSNNQSPSKCATSRSCKGLCVVVKTMQQASTGGLPVWMIISMYNEASQHAIS